MSLPLTKTLNPVDFALLEPEMRIVDKHFTAAREQHPMRRWEYAMALRAWREHMAIAAPASRTWSTVWADYPAVYDIGGAGSPFYLMLKGVLPEEGTVTVVDPEGPSMAEGGSPYFLKIPLENHVKTRPFLGDGVFCLSVLEHVDNLDQFLYHLSCLVAPGGLLFLTMDCCAETEHNPTIDTFHFNWMRKRIFAETDWQDIAWTMNAHEFAEFGTVDWRYHGTHVYDYTFASLALVKRA